MIWDNVADNTDKCHCTSGCCCAKLRSFSPMKQESADISLYESSPTISAPRCSHHQNKRRRPLEDVDFNSQDSGYGAQCSSDGRFSSPKRSFSSNTSMDDFQDISCLDDDEENAQLPGDFNKLISASLATTYKSPNMVQPCLFRRSVSMTTPNSTRVRSCLFRRDDESRPFKRPEPPTESFSPRNIKRFKPYEKEDNENSPPVKLVRSLSLSATGDSIKSALQRSSIEPDLIGDFSKQYCLPLINGRHADLKSISAETVAGLVSGSFDGNVASYRVIDCRFPYEFEGGHITGAVNLYTKQQIMDELLNAKIRMNSPLEEHEESKRHILVFHCEFSSERGPNLSRFLRQVDRTHNKDFYPNLHYPEIYLLDGGYKNFHEQFAEFCNPIGYLPMLHPSYEEDLKFFRTKSKTFNNDSRSKSCRALAFKRL